MNGESILEIKSKNLDDVKEYLVKDLYNYTVPEIVITGANHFSLDLEHLNYKVGTLNISHAKKVMEYLKKVWGTSIDLKTIDNKGKIFHITLDEAGFSL